MRPLPKLTGRQSELLMVINQDRHAILFDLEVQELEAFGLIEGRSGYYLITDRGYDVIMALEPNTHESSERGAQSGSPC